MFAVLPLVLLTMLTQLAVGLSAFTLWQSVHTGGSTETVSRRRWLRVFGAMVLGLVASLFYRNVPGIPGLPPQDPILFSLQGLLFVLCAALAFLTWQKQGAKLLGALTTLTGAGGLVVQSLVYTPVPPTSLSGLLPLMMFILSAAALGAVFVQLDRLQKADTSTWKNSERVEDAPDLPATGILRVLRPSLWALLVILALVPSLGGSGDAIMRAVSLAWMQTLPYWAGVMATAVALGLSYMGRSTAPLQVVLVLISVFCTRLTFFVDGVHLPTGGGI